jgi:hypothetical protein
MPWHSTLDGKRDHVYSIGMISIEHGNVELFLGRLLASVLDVDSDVGQAIYWCPQSASLRITILKTAAEQTFKPKYHDASLDAPKDINAMNLSMLTSVQSIIKRARTLTGQRHDRIHNLWGTDRNTSDVFRASAKAITTEEEPKAAPLEEMERIIASLRTLIDDIQKLIPVVNKHHNHFKWLLRQPVPKLPE